MTLKCIMRELKGIWVQGGAVKLESRCLRQLQLTSPSANDTRRGNWSCLVSIWKVSGETKWFLPLLGCMREDPAPSASIAFALNTLRQNVIKSLWQWWQTYDMGVKSDSPQCFRWPTSIYQPPTIILESTPHSCTIWEGCVRTVCVLSWNLQTSPPEVTWKGCALTWPLDIPPLQELCENRTCFGMVLGGSRGHGRAFYKDASRTKALIRPRAVLGRPQGPVNRRRTPLEHMIGLYIL